MARSVTTGHLRLFMIHYKYRNPIGIAVFTAALAALCVMGGRLLAGQTQERLIAAATPVEQIVSPVPGGTTAGTGLLSDSAGIRINPAAVRSYLAGSASLSHGTIAAGGCSTRAVPVTGAIIGDRVVLGPPSELLTFSLALTYAVTATDTVGIRLCNYTSSSITPPSWTWNVDVLKSF